MQLTYDQWRVLSNIWENRDNRIAKLDFNGNYHDSSLTVNYYGEHEVFLTCHILPNGGSSTERVETQ